MYLSRTQLLENLNLKEEVVEAFGGQVLIRELTAAKANSLGKQVNTDDSHAMILWVIASVVDADTKQPVFMESDSAGIGELSASEIIKIGKAAIRLNGFSSDAEAEAKNSKATTPSVSLIA